MSVRFTKRKLLDPKLLSLVKVSKPYYFGKTSKFDKIHTIYDIYIIYSTFLVIFRTFPVRFVVWGWWTLCHRYSVCSSRGETVKLKKNFHSLDSLLLSWDLTRTVLIINLTCIADSASSTSCKGQDPNLTNCSFGPWPTESGPKFMVPVVLVYVELVILEKWLFAKLWIRCRCVNSWKTPKSHFSGVSQKCHFLSLSGSDSDCQPGP